MYIVYKNKDGKWAVNKESATRALKLFNTKEEAIAYAKTVSSNNKTTYKVLDNEKSKEIKTEEVKVENKNSNKDNSNSNTLKKKTKKEKVAKGKIVKYSAFGLIIGIVIGFLTGVFSLIGVEFQLLGDTTETIALNEEYHEDGYTAYYNKLDISNKVNISFLKINGEAVEEIQTDVACTYLVVYNLKYEAKNIDITLVRTINITLAAVINSDSLSIHFLEVGNKYTGDSIYIKAGDTDILIDAGSRKNSGEAINSYIDQYCTDGILEYVIITHGHQDHIAGFVGSNASKGIFDHFTVKNIIMYDQTNSNSAIVKDLMKKIQNEIDTENAKKVTASECINESNGAQRIYEIADGITMEILDNYYYTHPTTDENDYSVCLMINDGLNNYLFTGDLEKDGEHHLVEMNDLPKVKLYKAGHHGSKTSSSAELLEVIQPQIVCVCCCTGSTEYTTNPLNTFPTQDFITRVGKYTDKIYVTSIESSNEYGYESLNGNIVVSVVSGVVSVNCTNNNIIFMDTDWFKKNRTWPTN